MKYLMAGFVVFFTILAIGTMIWSGSPLTFGLILFFAIVSLGVYMILKSKPDIFEDRFSNAILVTGMILTLVGFVFVFFGEYLPVELLPLMYLSVAGFVLMIGSKYIRFYRKYRIKS